MFSEINRSIHTKCCFGQECLPVVFELAIEMAAAEGDNSVGPAHSPEHAGLLEPGADYGLASGFDDARAEKQVLAAKLGVAHALGISLKAICLDADLFDLPLVQQSPLVLLHPGILFRSVVGM